jgi:DNA polymerase-1
LLPIPRIILYLESRVEVLLLDGYNLLYRAFTSLPQAIVSKDGRPINAVYGALSSTIRLLTDVQARRAVLAMDVPDTGTFRHALFPDYQAHRGPLGGEFAAEFARQAVIAREVFPALDIPSVQSPGFEADDVMGTLAAAFVASGGSATIVSTDRDLLQLVKPGLRVLVPGNPARVFASDQDVVDRIGVPPSGITTWKALAGDASDNVPGLKGIGTKTAAALVNTYGSLEAIYASLEALPPRTASLLRGQQERATLFRDVVTVHTDLNLGINVTALRETALADGIGVRVALERAGYGRP